MSILDVMRGGATDRAPSRPIDDHALLSDRRSAALVARDGAIDWWCAPSFDSAPAFAALLGDDRHGVWTLSPVGMYACREQRYLGESFVVQTTLEAEGGSVRLLDFMTCCEGVSHIVRVVEGLAGSVPMRTDLSLRPEFGSFVPHVAASPDGARCYGGSVSAVLRCDVPLTLGDGSVHALFAIGEGERRSFTLGWYREREPPPLDAEAALSREREDAARWNASLAIPPFAGEIVRRSAAVLRALIYAPTGALCAAPTTSLPERIGGEMNWDYRFTWVRDTAFAVWALLDVGAVDEASVALGWLLRTCAGRPHEIQSAYRIDGQRRISELLIENLPGYRGSHPVRDGNAAASQMQMDVFGELLVSAMRIEEAGRPVDAERWEILTEIGDALHAFWRQAGHGFWEVRGSPRHYVTDRTMTSVGMRALAGGAERRGDDERAQRYRQVADEAEASIREEFVDGRGVIMTTKHDPAVGATSLWPIVMGVILPDDPIATATLRAVERDLVRDGLVYRTRHDFPPAGRRREGAFLPCTGWLARTYALCGEVESARRAFAHLVATANEAGLFAEEYDPQARHMLGNMPQAFTHAEAIVSASVLACAGVRD